ncbi:DUF3667 domain-containing protein [Seonamhaeicola sp. MEBiC1930]|uniref:DUF3667 domain-containing protein n=1 Tax=Seonamhaeicola sp. MEBiC01930 TaxID=2976768 RepID=UPI00324F1B8A
MNCKNCHTELKAESDFCHNCGGKVIRNRLTIKNLLSHFGETFLNYDNKFLQTFITLFKKPEEVIETYITGTRKKYVNVISYFAIAITISGLYLFILKKFFPETIDYSFMVAPGQEEFQKDYMSFIQEYMSLVMMLYVPVYALMARLSFIGINKFNYTELLVIFLYLQGQMSITTAILGTILAFFGISQGIASFIFIPLMIIFCAFCLKRLYKINLANLLLRTLLFFAILGVVFVITSILMAIKMYFDGTFEQMMEAKKAASGG